MRLDAHLPQQLCCWQSFVGWLQTWFDLVYADHAVIDKEAAWEEAQTVTEFDDGNSMTNLLYWVATRP